DGQFNYFFSDIGDAAWIPQLRSEVNAAADLWEIEREYTGNSLVVLNEGLSGWSLRLVDLIGGDPTVQGRTICATKVIQIRSDLTGNLLRDVASHEFGHALGFYHTGMFDSDDGRTPLMATCLDPPGTDVRSFSNDDAGVIQKELSNSGGAAGSLHANWGFERWSGNIPLYWTFSLTHSKVKLTTGQQFGTAALGWKPLEDSAHVAQRVTLHRQAQTLTARASVNRQSPGTILGSVSVIIDWRRRDYAAVEPGSCAEGNYPTGRDQNEVTFLGEWAVLASGSFIPTTTWVSMDFASAPMPSAGDAIDIRIRAVSSVKGTDGQFRQINFDNTRVWES
ncbi:MAG: hypothetical protein M3488_04095, partial [Actinomycetota bacterium]|nr:hypothetical protein [Actinomycetota bacterium]